VPIVDTNSDENTKKPIVKYTSPNHVPIQMIITQRKMNAIKHSWFFIVLFIFLISLFPGCIVDEWSPTYDESYTVKVTKVIDGDTIRVLLPNGNEDTIRFLGIDTPELSIDSMNPYVYGKSTNMDCLLSYGFLAKDYVTDTILKKDIEIEFDASAGFKDRYDRWLSYIALIDGTDLCETLLSNGYARVYSLESFSKKQTYLLIEQSAQQQNMGLWGCVSIG
jgi:micrococcal nuclease